MRTLGMATAQILVWLLFVSATVSVLLGGVLAALWAIVWRGLEFPVGAREVAFLIGVGAGLAALGFAIWFALGRRRRWKT